MKYEMLQVNIKNKINKGIGDEIYYSESQIYEYIARVFYNVVLHIED